MKKSTIIIIVIVVLVLGYVGVSYNGLVSASTLADAQWAQVETQYQRRLDLIPNVVNTVKGITAQEQTVFGDLARARERYSGAKSTEEKVDAANGVESSLGRLFVIVENYPTLRSSDNFLSLQAELAGTENRVSVERGRYNEAVRNYNVLTKRFPGSLVASVFGFDERSYFESESGSEKAPEVKF